MPFSYKSGHRQRLRQKFLHNIGCSDIEILEILLFYAVPRIDVKPLAHALMLKFKSLQMIIHASEHEIGEIVKSDSVREKIICLLKLSQEISDRALLNKIKEDVILNNLDDLNKYLRSRFGNIKYEKFSVIYLDSKNIIIEITEFGSGTIDESTIYIREIIKCGLVYGASSMILVHNHPSGSSEPSKSDILLTNAIVKVATSVNIKVMDHIIVTIERCFSFRDNFLLHS